MNGWKALALTCAILASACGSKNGSTGSKSIRIGMVPKGSTHEHWKRVHAGAAKAAQEFAAAGTPVEVLWKAPIPRASAATAAMVNPGLFQNMRIEWRASRKNSLIGIIYGQSDAAVPFAAGQTSGFSGTK